MEATHEKVQNHVESNGAFPGTLSPLSSAGKNGLRKEESDIPSFGN